METIKMITKVTGQTVIAVPSDALVPGACASFGLGLVATGLSVADGCSVSGLGNTEGTAVETGLSGNWATFGAGRELRTDRPTQAPKAAVVAGMHGHYAQVSGAGAVKQQDQLISQAEAAFIGAGATRMRAFRGPEPWSERTT